MKFSDYIKNILNKMNIKMLPEPHLVETELVPISFKGKDQKEFAEFIKEKIEGHKELYKVFLEEHDGISIGNSKNEFNNPLKIELGEKYLHHKKETITYRPRFSFSEKVYSNPRKLEAVEETFENAFFKEYKEVDLRRIESCKEIYEKSNKLEYSNEEQERIKDFYKSIVIKNETNIRQYEFYLSSMGDWQGLKMLWQSNNCKEFAEKYLDKKAVEILNNTIDLYTDRRYNNFFEKNIDILKEASNIFKKDGQKVVEKLLEKIKEILNSNEKDSSVESVEEKGNISESNNEFNKDKIIFLTKEILDYIDSTGKMKNTFEEKIKSGNIIVYDVNEEYKENEHVFYTKKDIESKRFFYSVNKDACFLPISNKITDITATIHEFIHQYYNNNAGKITNINEYSDEIPSIFFEKVAMDYLCNKGFRQYDEILQNEFLHRKVTDFCNNTLGTSTNDFINVTKLKKDTGKVTMQNIFNENTVKLINNHKKDNYEDRDIDDIKKDHIKGLVKSYINRDKEKADDIINMCSYSLGTYFAENYCDDEKMKKRMLRLINDPEYSIQNIIDSVKEVDNKEKNVVLDKKVEKEDEKER